MECTQEVITLITIGAALFTILGVMIGMFLHLGNKIDSLTLSIYAEMASFQKTMAQEAKDFHGRLCAIEERNKK